MPSRGNIYQSLILAAQDCLEQTGALPTDMAALAKAAEIGEDEARSLFASQDELYEAVVYQAVTLLNDALREGAIASNSDDPIQQLQSIAGSYLGWAEENKALFRLLVTGLNGPMKPDSTLYRFTTSMHELYLRKLEEARRVGILAEDTDIESAMLLLHCIVKGGNIMLVTRANDPWLANDPRATVDLAKKIFAQFIDNMVRANAPGAKVRQEA